MNSIFKHPLSLVFLLLTCPNMLLAQGIDFIKGSFQEAIDAAKKAQKPLFIEVYLDGCPHCAALEPILKQKQTGDFFNSNFVCYKIEANSENSKTFQVQKNISYVEFPLFFFLDANTGDMLHQSAPSERPTVEENIKEVISHGENALNPKERTSNYAKRYADGDRDFIFLVNYAKLTKTAKDFTKLRQIGDDLGKILVLPSDLESSTGFYILQRVIIDFDNPIAIYFFNHLDTYRTKFPAKDVKDTGDLITYYTLYGEGRDKLTSAKVTEIYNAFLKLGIPPAEAQTRTILKELEALFREKNTLRATERFNAFYPKVKGMTPAVYAYYARLFNEKATDNTYIPSIFTWIKNGVAMVKPNERNKKEVADLYLEQAKAYARIGKTMEAKKASAEALKIATTAKIDTKEYAIK